MGIFDKIKFVMRKKTKIIIVCVAFFCLLLCFCFVRGEYCYLKNKIDLLNDKLDRLLIVNEFDYSWMNDQKTYSHALGINESGIEYTNSLESFNKNYERGQRVFEIDLDVTNDNKIICSHDKEKWHLISNTSDDVDYTYDNFMNSKIDFKYTPLDYKDIIDLLNKYKDIYINIDGKYHNKEYVYLEYKQIVSYAKEVDITVLDRIIPEIYTTQMLDMIMNIYPFKSIEYCIKSNKYDISEIGIFCMDTGVNFVTFNAKYINDETIEYFKSYNINIGLFAINDISEAKGYFEKGVDIICSDSLVDSDFD